MKHGCLWPCVVTGVAGNTGLVDLGGFHGQNVGPENIGIEVAMAKRRVTGTVTVVIGLLHAETTRQIGVCYVVSICSFISLEKIETPLACSH